MVPQFAAEFEQVTKAYPAGFLGRRAVQALRGVSFAIPCGSVYGILGPNRAGKTTLVKILLSLTRAGSGDIRRLGAPVRDRHTLARVGYLHECQAFPSYLTATALLEYYGSLSFVTSSALRRRVPELLEIVGLADRAREPIARFSKGMVQRLALAQALVNDPELLVLDEPTEGMDLVARQLLHDTIRSRRQAGKTVVLVSHSLHDVEQLCDRVAVVRCGELAFEGPLDQLPGSGQAGGLEQALEPLYAGAAS
jgi:ABC-2 type transport system ATP-binding protein